MAISDQDKQDVAEMVVQALKESDDYRRMHCRYTIEPGQHERDHEAIQDIAEFFKRANNIKWDSLKFVVTLIIGAGLVTLARALGFTLTGPGGGP